MAFKKGEKRPPNAGRKKGSVNKVTVEIKTMIRNALDAAGGEDYLVKQATETPTAFMSLIAKTIPSDVNHGGQPENPFQVKTAHGLDKETIALMSRFVDKQNRLKGKQDEQR